MASTTTSDKHGTSMATDPTPGAPGDRPRESRPGDKPAGFFKIYKPTQGRVTRLATGFGIALLVGLTAWFLHREVPAWFVGLKQSGSNANHTWWNILVGLITLGMAALGWWMVNRVTSADFLIATDSEMKKVNWTSRKELWGSTKVVIFFMLAIAAALFVIDLVFHYLFWLMNVLKFKPLGM
jgi:preprotein translocase SecE subunit